MASLTEIILSGAWLLPLAILGLLLISSILSGSETGFTGASQAKLHQYAREGNQRAARALSLLHRRHRLIATILFGNNLVNVLASAMASAWFFSIFAEAGILYTTVIMTLLIVVFAEILPKNIALARPERIAMLIAGPMGVLIRILAPIVWVIEWFVNRLTGFDPAKNLAEVHGERELELRGAIDLHHDEEPETDEERKMLSSILDLDEVTVETVMTHRVNVEMIDLDDRQADAITKILESPYTRLPLYKSDHETIVGVLHARALLRAIGSNHLGGSNPSLAGKARPPIDLEKIAAKPWFIPETTSLLDQLQEFRERREHFALVVDEYGSFQGIVTLEDILEQIVGNIHDELDTPAKGIWPQHDGSYVIDGAKSLRELNRELDWQFPEDQAATLAGLILDEARMIPMPKQVFTFHAMRFEVLAREHNRLTRIRVTPLGTSTPAEPIQNTQQTGIGPRP